MPAFLSSSSRPHRFSSGGGGDLSVGAGSSEGDGGAAGVSLRTGRRVCVAFFAQPLGFFTSSPLLHKGRPRGEAAAGGTAPARPRLRVQFGRCWAPLPGGCGGDSRGGGGEAGRRLESPGCGRSTRSRLGSALQHLSWGAFVASSLNTNTDFELGLKSSSYPTSPCSDHLSI